MEGVGEEGGKRGRKGEGLLNLVENDMMFSSFRGFSTQGKNQLD